MIDKRAFVLCILPCAFCKAPLAALHTCQVRVPWKKLSNIAREAGAVRDASGSMFCGPGCRMNHRLEHSVHHLETPEVI